MYDKRCSNAGAVRGYTSGRRVMFFDRGLPVEDTFLPGFFLWKQVLGSKLMMRLSDWV
jgi:hypothetical protein